MASKLRRAQRFGDPLRLQLRARLPERWRWEQAAVHQRKPRDAGGPHVEPPPSDCAGMTSVLRLGAYDIVNVAAGSE